MLIMYRPSWQRLRLSCTQDYAPDGGLKTVVGTNSIFQRMREYVNSINEKWSQDEMKRMRWSSDLESAVRTYRVHNFFVAAINGLERVKGITHLPAIKEEAAKIESELDLHSIREGNDSWDWDVVSVELRNMLITDNVWFHHIYADMKERVVEKGKTADDMREFINRMREVNSLYRNDSW